MEMLIRMSRYRSPLVILSLGILLGTTNIFVNNSYVVIVSTIITITGTLMLISRLEYYHNYYPHIQNTKNGESKI